MTSRRSFLRGSSVLMAHAALGAVVEVFAATQSHEATFFTESEMRTLRALVDVILPETDSPAASAANTHYFIDLAIPACATPAARDTLRKGLAEFAGYDKLSLAEQNRRLADRAATDIELPYDQSFFKILKDYTMTGYFLSETGATQALAYLRIPGGFQGDIPLAPNQKAWAI